MLVLVGLGLFVVGVAVFGAVVYRVGVWRGRYGPP